MLLRILVLLSVAASFQIIEASIVRDYFDAPVGLNQVNRNQNDPGKPLFLTPYIRAGKLDEARKLSKVGPLDGTDVTSYSGYLTVNDKYQSNLFFWFFPAQQKPKDAPILLWLQGGPGGSSLFGLFNEHGPFQVTSDLKLLARDLTWAKPFNLLYIDNPVGTGFSFTSNDAGYANNQDDVARDLYEALTQFFTLFKFLSKNEFYVTGESYAGKYVPAIAYKIHTENPTAKRAINLKGVAIGDGLCDPETMVDYGDMLYRIGLIDQNHLKHFNEQQELAVKYIQNEQWIDAFKVFDTLLNGDLIPYPSYFKNATGLSDYYNYLNTESPVAFGYYSKYVLKAEVRKAIHVGNTVFSDGKTVEKHLMEDVMKSVKPWVSTLMENYRVLLYSGQLDIIVGFALTENFVSSIKWRYADEYQEAPRSIWRLHPDDREVAGYVKQVHDFYLVLVRNAGHILPYDQPQRAYDMINRFILNKPFVN